MRIRLGEILGVDLAEKGWSGGKAQVGHVGRAPGAPELD